MKNSNLIKRITKILVLNLIIIILIQTNIYAASFSATANGNTIDVGNTTTITINASGLTGRFLITSSNPSVATVSTGSIWLENNSANVTITGKVAGNATITIKNATDTDGDSLVADSSNGVPYTGLKTVSITVKTPNTPSGNAGNTNTNTNNSNKSSNNYLKSLLVAGKTISPVFRKTTTQYSLEVDENTTSIQVSAATEDSKASYKVTGNTNLQAGTNKVTIRVTAENGATKDYIINVVKAGEVTNENEVKDSKAKLRMLYIENYDLTPIFDADVFDYTMDINADVEKLEIEATPDSDKAKVEIRGNEDFREGENLVEIEVIAEDGTIKTYVIKVNKLPNASQVDEKPKWYELNDEQIKALTKASGLVALPVSSAILGICLYKIFTKQYRVKRGKRMI